MKDISKIIREDRLTFQNKNDLLRERNIWLKKERKKDKRKENNRYGKELRKIGYIVKWKKLYSKE